MTYAEIAALLGTTKGVVYTRATRKLAKLLKPHTSIVDGVTQISPAGVEILRCDIKKTPPIEEGETVAESADEGEQERADDKIDAEIIAMLAETVGALRAQLDTKDEQIARKDEQISGLIEVQQLTMRADAIRLLAAHEDAERQEIAPNVPEETDAAAPPETLWSRIRAVIFRHQ